MGSIQLLLIVVGVIAVSIGLVAGISAFSGSADAANRDQISSELVQMAGNAQTYFKKPAPLGGGDRSFMNIDFESMGFASTTESAIYTIPFSTPNVFYVIAFSNSVNGARMIMRCTKDEVRLYTFGWGKMDWEETYLDQD